MTPLFLTWHLPVGAGAVGAATAGKKAIQSGETLQKLYDLRSWVIVANEVRMLVYPKTGVSHIMQTITKATHQATPPSYEYRWIRSSRECAELVRVMERVPVLAGLVSRPEQWPWSSANAD